MWSCPEEERRARVTELGWTMTPPESDDQVMHADIVCWDPLARKDAGRFHHFLWKTDPEERCSTKIVPRGFTQGTCDDDHYTAWTQVSAKCVIFDSEVLHLGAAVGPGRWGSSCTAQVSSSEGWMALTNKESSGISDMLLEYTIRIAPHGRRWEVGSRVSAEFEGSWHDATVIQRFSDGSYRVAWSGEDTITDGVQPSQLRRREDPAGSGRKRSCKDVSVTEPPCKQRRCGRFAPGTEVLAEFGGAWFDATVICRCKDGTYNVAWASADAVSDGLQPTQLCKVSLS